ncbi:protein kinase [Colletotrichum sojae]|uniref:Protein kinase n=1 Tax=Colletotrichum sojae TaxID=2175907 RepID=A0A8H6IWP7_9PEZI|nr:protein kinase [Colletotrichum sojae]
MAEESQPRHLLVNGGPHSKENQEANPEQLTNGFHSDGEASVDYVKDLKGYRETFKDRPEALPLFAASRGGNVNQVPTIEEDKSSSASQPSVQKGIPEVSITPSEEPGQETKNDVTRKLGSGANSDGSGTTVRDYGLSDQLKQAPGKVLAQETQDHLVVQTGQAFLQDQTAKPPSVLEGLELAEELRQERVDHPHEERGYFIPIDSLKKVITHDSVIDELQRPRESGNQAMEDSLCKDIAEFVCDKHEIQPKPGEKTKGEKKYTSGRKLFAILVLIDKSRMIQRFIAEKLTDKDLPFKIVTTRGVSRLFRKDSPDSHIKSFDGWKTFEIESFETYQYYLLSPFFSSSNHYHFETKTLLPFTESDERYHSDEQIGGYGAVFRNDNPYYAVKRLISHDEFAFRREVDTLKRFSNRPHDNLIRLLATYEHANSHYLIFPWADGNLRQFWERNPEPKLDRYVAFWMARQCHGLVIGLSKIHNYQSKSSTSDSTNLTASNASPRGKPYGRHSDMKPENVLWFKDPYSTEDISGILKISDFGFTQFNSKMSRSRIPNRHMPQTPTYRPPECDLPQDEISQSYDMWTLGCLYLEFAVWLLKGFHAVNETFPDDRQHDNKNTQYPDVIEDTFFNLDETGAYLKPSVVKWINDLHADENCTAYLHDLLDLTLESLLNPSPRKRAKCLDVVKKLAAMEKKYEEDETYCLEGIPTPAEATPPAPYLGKQRGEEPPLQRILDGRSPFSTSPRNSLDFGSRLRENLPRPGSPLRREAANATENNALDLESAVNAVVSAAPATILENNPATGVSTTRIEPDENDKTFDIRNLEIPSSGRPESLMAVAEDRSETLGDDNGSKGTDPEQQPGSVGPKIGTPAKSVSKDRDAPASHEDRTEKVEEQRQSFWGRITSKLSCFA